MPRGAASSPARPPPTHDSYGFLLQVLRVFAEYADYYALRGAVQRRPVELAIEGGGRQACAQVEPQHGRVRGRVPHVPCPPSRPVPRPPLAHSPARTCAGWLRPRPPCQPVAPLLGGERLRREAAATYPALLAQHASEVAAASAAGGESEAVTAARQVELDPQ